MSSCHHVIMPSCHHVIMPSCHHAIMSSCHHAIMSCQVTSCHVMSCQYKHDHLGHVEAEQLQPGAGLHPQPLGSLGTGGWIIFWLYVAGYILCTDLAGSVEAASEHGAAQTVQVPRNLVSWTQHDDLMTSSDLMTSPIPVSQPVTRTALPPGSCSLLHSRPRTSHASTPAQTRC